MVMVVVPDVGGQAGVDEGEDVEEDGVLEGWG